MICLKLNLVDTDQWQSGGLDFLSPSAQPEAKKGQRPPRHLRRREKGYKEELQIWKQSFAAPRD